MKGAREYRDALRYMVKNEISGFQYGCNNDVITNGHFVFVLGEHARGYTMHVYLVKDTSGKYSVYNRTNSLEVYGIVSGQPGWTEVYSFTTDNKTINDALQVLLDTALECFQKNIEKGEMLRKEREQQQKLEEEERIKEFAALIDQEKKIDTMAFIKCQDCKFCVIIKNRPVCIRTAQKAAPNSDSLYYGGVATEFDNHCKYGKKEEIK